MKRPIQRTRIREPETDVGKAVLDGFAVADGRLPSASARSEPAQMPGRTAGGAAATAKAVAGARLPAGAGAMLAAAANSGIRDVIDDDEARAIAGVADPVPPTPENLPAVIQTAIAETDGTFVPRWHMVRHLPGYLRNQIRGLGRQVFAQFTDTPIEDVQTVTTLTNSETEVKALMHWIRRNGVRDDRAEMDFEGTIPGYKADVQVWNSREYSFLLVKDFAGYYVYGWPGGRGVHLEYDPPKMIR